MSKVSKLNYLNFSSELHYLNQETDIGELSKFFDYVKSLNSHLFFLGECLFYLIDYRQRRYLAMAGPVLSLCSYHPNDFLEGGLDFLADIYQEDDFRVLNNHIFPVTIDLLKTLPQESHSQYVFEYNFRFRHKAGSYFSVWQKGGFITDPISRLPLYSFGVVFNITTYKKDTRITRVISRCDPQREENPYQTVSTDYFYPDPSEALLSKREKEILLRMAEGWSSKQIAAKLRISMNTVLNHRKNILRKTNTKNVAELISHSIRSGII